VKAQDYSLDVAIDLVLNIMDFFCFRNVSSSWLKRNTWKGMRVKRTHIVT